MNGLLEEAKFFIANSMYSTDVKEISKEICYDYKYFYSTHGFEHCLIYKNYYLIISKHQTKRFMNHNLCFMIDKITKRGEK